MKNSWWCLSRGLCVAFGSLAAVLWLPSALAAQTVESVGSRALGMGGAFVAVANDSSATWWNPGALADGPFLDMTLGRATAGIRDARPAWRGGMSQFSIATPPGGFSYYRLRISEVPPLPTAEGEPNREEDQGGTPLRSLSASQIGVTLVQSLLPGVHAGATFKYVRGTLRTGADDDRLPVDELLDRGDDLEGGDTEHRFDLDMGILAVAGPVRVGVVVRNVRAVEFGEPGVTGGRFALPRQVRVGGAFDADPLGVPFTFAVDADVRRYATARGDRRVVALGAEHWILRRRLAVRGGGRFNTIGAEERAATAGLSVGVRTGFFVEGHLVRGGDADERGWGVAARVSF
jgi:long-chain fatty acid transport protein